MKKITFYWINILLVIVLVFSCLEEKNNDTFVFTHVNVIPMDEEIVYSDYNVVVKKGKIIDIGLFSTVDVPKGATVINAKGKYMIPSLTDMHVHLEGFSWNIMFPDNYKYSKEELNFEDILFLYIANGITTIDVMSALPEHIEIRDKINKNEMFGPRLILSRMIDAAGKAWPEPICTGINNAEEATKAVTDLHKQGYDRVKVYSFLDKDSYDAIITTAKSIDMPVDGHIPFSTSIEYVLSSGQNMIAHTEEVMKLANEHSPEQISYYANLIAQSDTWVSSTLILNRNLIELFKDNKKEFTKYGTEYLHPMGEGIWAYIYENFYKPIPESAQLAIKNGYNSFQKPFTNEFYKSGGKLLIGTDALIPSTLPGFSLHEELEELNDLGLTPFEVLKISTTNTFAFLGELDVSGTIEIEKNANLVLLDANPLKDISNTRKIFGVMTQNKWISKDEIDKRLVKISDSYTELRNKKTQ